MVIGYSISLFLSLALLIAYLALVKKKEFWLGLLFIFVTIVNLGYLLLSIATMLKSLPFAIVANDVSYFGSVFLSVCMFLTVVKLSGFKVTKAHIISCFTLGALMFFIVAISPVLPLYYKSVSIETIDGITKFTKDYGPLHNLYLFYLVVYFASMIGAIIHSSLKKKIGSPKFAALITGVVCGNIIVWAFEKFIDWDFEFLSITYIASEIVLLLLYWMMQDYVHVKDIPTYTDMEKEKMGVDIATMPMEIKLGKILYFVKENEQLAPREREILEMILENKKRKDIASDLHLSENTVKTYTRNLYSKLGVSSRDELYSLLLKN